MKTKEALEVAKAFLESEYFDNVTIDQDDKWNCSIKIESSWINKGGIDSLTEIMKSFPELGFLIEGESEIHIFMPEDEKKEKSEGAE
jgi:hypothetical protein